MLANARRSAAVTDTPLQRAWATGATQQQKQWVQAAKTVLFAAENNMPMAVVERLCRQLLPALDVPNCPTHYTDDSCLWEIVEALAAYFKQKLVEVRSMLVWAARQCHAQLPAARAPKSHGSPLPLPVMPTTGAGGVVPVAVAQAGMQVLAAQQQMVAAAQQRAAAAAAAAAQQRAVAPAAPSSRTS